MNNFYENEKYIKASFENDETLLELEINDPQTNNLLCKLFFLDAITDSDKIAETIVKPIKENLDNYLFVTNPKIKKENDLTKVIKAMLAGHTILLFTNINDIFLVDTKKPFIRGIAEPTSELIVKGPKDGFLENIMVNIALVRSHLRNEKLKIKFLEMENLDRGKIALLYLDDCVDFQVLNILKKRIENHKNSIIVDANNLKEKIDDVKYFPINTIGNTQRPDVLTYKLMEGKIAILIDGSPVCLFLPLMFDEIFQTIDDYYTNYFFASLNRLTRFVCFLLSTLIPAIYIALMTHHQELLPTKLVMSVIASRKGVPFPTAIECLVFLIIYEVLREAGSKTTSVLGSALSIVGALIIGQTAVEARIVSTSVVIIVAIASMTALVNPKVSGLQFLLRVGLMGLAALFGIQGILIGIILTMIKMLRTKSFGYDYVSGLFSLKGRQYLDTYVRLPNDKKN